MRVAWFLQLKGLIPRFPKVDFGGSDALKHSAKRKRYIFIAVSAVLPSLLPPFEFNVGHHGSSSYVD